MLQLLAFLESESSFFSAIHSAVHFDAHVRRVLAGLAATTVIRYITTFNSFAKACEDLDVCLLQITAVQAADILVTLQLQRQEDPTVGSSAITCIKAVRWVCKNTQCIVFEVFYGELISSFLKTKLPKDRRESLPLPLYALVQWERRILQRSTPLVDVVLLGAYLVTCWSSLRFADSQRIEWSSFAFDVVSLRAIAYQTKTSHQGQPFGFHQLLQDHGISQELTESELAGVFPEMFPDTEVSLMQRAKLRAVWSSLQRRSNAVKRNWSWIPWKSRMTQKMYEDSLMQKPAKRARIETLQLSDLLLDEPPQIDINDSTMGISMIRRLLEVHDNALALAGTAHLVRLKAYTSKFLSLVSQKFPPETNLRLPSVLEAQQADKHLWSCIFQLVIEKEWQVNDAIYEFTEIRGDMSSWLQPRAKAASANNRRPYTPGGRDNHRPPTPPPGRGIGKGKGKAKGSTKQGTQPKGVQWVREFKEGSQVKRLCMGWQIGKCQRGNSCEFTHGCAFPKPDGSPCLSKDHGRSSFLMHFKHFNFVGAAHQRLFDCILCSLREAPWPQQVRRAHIISGVTSALPELCRDLNALCRYLFPTEHWNTLCVSRNGLSALHSDSANIPGSRNLSLSLGAFSGGHLWIEDLSCLSRGQPTSIASGSGWLHGCAIDTHRKAISFDGRTSGDSLTLDPCLDPALDILCPDLFEQVLFLCGPFLMAAVCHARANNGGKGFPLHLGSSALILVPSLLHAGSATPTQPQLWAASYRPLSILAADLCATALPQNGQAYASSFASIAAALLHGEGRELSLQSAEAAVPRKSLFTGPHALHDGAGKCSMADWSSPAFADKLHGLRKAMLQFCISLRADKRLLARSSCPSPEPLFSSTEVSAARDLHCGDPDIHLFPHLRMGVPTGHMNDIPPSNCFWPSKGQSGELIPLTLNLENWKSADVAPRVTSRLLQEELDAGYCFKFEGALEEAKSRWPVGLALGKLGVVRAPGRAERLHWWGRVGGCTLRLLHILLFLAHVGLLFVDDFIFSQAASLMPLSGAVICLFLQVLGIPVSWKKLQISCRVDWIGWRLCFSSGTVSLRDEKRLRLLDQVRSLLRRGGRISTKELESFLGLAMWACALFPTMRAMLHPFYKDLWSPAATNFSIAPESWHGIRNFRDASLRFKVSPPHTATPAGAKLLSARHVPFATLADLSKVAVTHKRLWLRVECLSSSRRKLSNASIRSLHAFERWLQHVAPLASMRPLQVADVEAFADASASGPSC
ncbi:unnamed protein product, partial [Symbiodinium sp. CCMP2592]